MDNKHESSEEHARTFSGVDHEYHDYAAVSAADVSRLFPSSGCGNGSSLRQHNPHASGTQQQGFAVKLHYMLTDIDASGDSSIISWQPHGRCFVVHDRNAFVERVLPSYFMQSTFASFQRQCNLYGFKRISSAQDKGGYYHQLFLRAKPDLPPYIQRIKRKGKGPRKPDSPETEPDFYSMPYLPASAQSVSVWPASSGMQEQRSPPNYDDYSSKAGTSMPVSSLRALLPASVPSLRSSAEQDPRWYGGGYPPHPHNMIPQPMLHPSHYQQPLAYASREHYEAAVESASHHPQYQHSTPAYGCCMPPPYYYGSMHPHGQESSATSSGPPNPPGRTLPHEPTTYDEPESDEVAEPQPSSSWNPPRGGNYAEDHEGSTSNEDSRPAVDVLVSSSGSCSNEVTAAYETSHAWPNALAEREDDFWSRSTQ